MCGLVGAFRADDALFSHKIVNFMDKGLYVSAVRGVEGTGVGLVDKNFVPGHAKTQYDAATFLQTRQYGFAKKAMQDARVILGHTRHSTVMGSISQENSHPFQWRNGDNEILFTHNGHINNANMLSHKNFHHQVDSAHVANALLYNKDTDVLQEMMGFYVCIWFDKKSKTVKMARNNSRDLYYVYNKAKTQIYYASEAEILSFILDRESIETDGDFLEIEPGKLLVWDLASKTLANPEVVNYTEKKSTPHWQGGQALTTKTSGSTSGAHGGAGGTGGTESGTSSRIGILDPIGPALPNDIIFMKTTTFENFVSNGKKIGLALNPHPEDWGHLYGVRATGQTGAIIVLQTQRKVIDECLKYIPDRIPCYIKTAKLIDIGEDGAKLDSKDQYWCYECNVDTSKARLAAFHVKKAQQAKADAERTREGASDPLAGGTGTEPSTSTETSEGKAVVPFAGAPTSSGLVPGPGPESKIPVEDWMRMADDGCFFCQGQISSADIGKVAFYKWPHPPEDHSVEYSLHDYQIICPICRIQCALPDDALAIDNKHAVIQKEVSAS